MFLSNSVDMMKNLLAPNAFVSPKKNFSYTPTIEWEFYSKNYSLIMHEKVFTFEEKVKKYESY